MIQPFASTPVVDPAQADNAVTSFVWRQDGPCGVVHGQCAALVVDPVRHGFFTRKGGIGPELDLRRDLPPSLREQALQRLSAALGYHPAQVFEVRQVHGSRVVTLTAAQRRAEVALLEADALVTNLPGTAVAVSTADCVPVLLFDPQQRVVAAVHAGWRGLVAGVLEATVHTMVEQFASRAAMIVAAIGPRIGAGAYQVGQAVAQQFSAYDAAIQQTAAADGSVSLDLGRVAWLKLRACGVQQVFQSEWCTYAQPELFYSYRREAERAGRQLSVIGLA